MVKQRTIVVTGSSSGIGRHIAEELLGLGYCVIGLCRHPERLKSDFSYIPIRVDLGELASISGVMTQTIKQYPEIDGLVSNAGMPLFAGLEQLSVADIEHSIAVNLTSHILLARCFIPFFKTKKNSDYLFIGSESAVEGGAKGSVYCAAKFGLRGFAQSLRKESSKQGVRVSMLHPGMVATPFFDDLNFAPGDACENSVDLNALSGAVRMILEAPLGTVFDEIYINPLKKVVRRR